MVGSITRAESYDLRTGQVNESQASKKLCAQSSPFD